MLNIKKNTIEKSNTKNALIKLNQVSDILPANNALDFFDKLGDAYQTYRVTEVELRKIEAQRDILITEIIQRYELS